MGKQMILDGSEVFGGFRRFSEVFGGFRRFGSEVFGGLRYLILARKEEGMNGNMLLESGPECVWLHSSLYLYLYYRKSGAHFWKFGAHL